MNLFARIPLLRGETLAIACLLVLGAHVVLYARMPVSSISAENSAAPDSLLTLQGSRVLRQELQIEKETLSALALRYDETKTEANAVLEITARDNTAPLEKLSGALATWKKPLPDNEKNILASGWLVIPLHITLPQAALLSVELRLADPSLGPVVFHYQHDGAKYAEGKLFLNGKEQYGDLGFRAYRALPMLERLSFHYIEYSRLAELVFIVLFFLLCAVSLECVSALRAGKSLLRDPPLLLLFFLALLFTVPLFFDAKHWGIWDWPEAVAHYDAAWQSLRHGQFPLWNPYFCGGNPLWGNPQAYWPSLTFLFTIPLGAVLGTKVAVTSYFFLGMWGMYALARELGFRSESALVAAIIFLCSGFLGAHLAAGQLLWLTLAWLPWAAAWLIKSLNRPWGLVPASLFFLLILFEGRVHLVVYGGIAIAILFFGVALERKQLRRALVRAVGFASLVLLLGAIRILPMLSFLQSLEGNLQNTDGIPLARIKEVLFTRTIAFEYTLPWMTLPWHEYAFYLGVGAGILSLGGAVMLFRARWVLAATIGTLLLLFGAIMTSKGETSFVERLPVLSELRNPGRAGSIVVFALSLLAAGGMEGLRKARSERKLSQAIGLLIALMLFADFFFVAMPSFGRIFSAAPLEFEQRNAPFFQTGGYSSGGYHVVHAGYGARDYCPPHLLLSRPDARVRAREEEGYQGEVETKEGSEATLVSFSPNALRVAIGNIRGPADLLIVNQKYHPGWRGPSRAEQSEDGRLTFALRPEHAHATVELRYLPWPFVLGSMVTLATAVALMLLRFRRHFRLRLLHP